MELHHFVTAGSALLLAGVASADGLKVTSVAVKPGGDLAAAQVCQVSLSR